MKCSRWFKSTPTTIPENEVVSEDDLFATAEEKPKDV
jgi:hypothetical protein